MSELSPAQLEANQENSKKGGVKTEEGKAISRYNAVKHGILKEAVSDYEQDLYEERIEQLIEQYEPIGMFENMLIERIALYDLKLHRIARAEKEFMKATLDPRRIKIVDEMDGFMSTSREVVVNEGYVPKVNGGAIQSLSEIYLRYEITVENRMYRAIHELQRLQATRKGEGSPLPLSLDINLDKPE